MRVQAYTSFSGFVVTTVATPRPEGTPSMIFTAATIHEDYAASVRSLMEEHKHLDADFPAAGRIASYFPKFNGLPIYALRQLMPAGAPRDVDADFQLEIMRIRYQLEINLLPGAWLTDARVRNAIERNVVFAMRQLYQANGLPDVYLPGENGIRGAEDGPSPRTEIDIICELGPASARTAVEVAAP